MSPSKSEEDTKKTGLRPEPLCLFRLPEDTHLYGGRATYVNPVRKKETESRISFARDQLERRLQAQKIEEIRAKEKEDFWLRKRAEARIRRRRMKEPVRNLRTFLLTSVNNETVQQKSLLPSLYEVLETVKDAWPSPNSRNFHLPGIENPQPPETKRLIPQQRTMKNPQLNLQFPSQLLNRRYSVPEELMRKHSVSHEKTSEESETNKTVIEKSSPSSSSSTNEQEETVRQKDVNGEESTTTRPPEKADASQQTNDTESENRSNKKSEGPKRVTQNDYYSQGKRIIKVKSFPKGSQVATCTCRCEKPSSTTASAKEDTEDSATSESLPSSSPFLLPKRESSSGNLSSESDCMRCTCAELTSSKETSTDIFHSGKSTLSQTVSDKSVSTQDSTVSINSVSTRGSTGSDNSNSTSPEIERTSAKETTTSPDYSPRTPRNTMNRKNRRREKFASHYHSHKKNCPRHSEVKHSTGYFSLNYKTECPVHSDLTKAVVSCGTKTEVITAEAKNEVEVLEQSRNPNVSEKDQVYRQEISFPKPQTECPSRQDTENRYKWAKLSQEELYMMQQLRHKKFVESQRSLTIPLPSQPDTNPATTCGTGTGYNETECIEHPIMIPRYSALPRTLSMLVNTSSGDSIHNSDSDNQSLADSLEDQPITHVHKLFFDTKKEAKPVRGDVNAVEDRKLKYRQPRGRAFFVSIKDPFGEDEMLEKIEKIPQPPEKIKNRIFQRHLSVCAKHKRKHQLDSKVEQSTKKERKGKGANSKEGEKTSRKTEELKKNSQKTVKKKEDRERHQNHSEGKSKKRGNEKPEESQNQKDSTSTKKKKETKDQRERFGSKIPVLVSSRSTSSSTERDVDPKNKPRPKIRLKREKEKRVEEKKEEEEGEEIAQDAQKLVETTQILQISQSERDLSLQKPQAIIHPSQIPCSDFGDQLSIPPLVSTLRVPPPYRSRQLIVTQARRSPIGKFRQRFEVIPEEKSSSLSSAEEKNNKGSVQKFADACTSPLLEENKNEDQIQVQSYNVSEVPKIIVAKIANKQLETLPYVDKNDNRKIILFSSKEQNSNSSKGRDALIAMNREDFNRLAKGWMNFYKLNETLDYSENEENITPNKARMEGKKKEPSKVYTNKVETNSNQNKSDDVCKEPLAITKTSDQCQVTNTTGQLTKSIEPQLNEDIRFHSSNTILRSVKEISCDSIKSGRRQSSLPELRLPSQRSCEVHKSKTSGDSLPRMSKCLVDDDDTDSDITDYLEPPGPRVPPLPLADFPSDGTLSSSDSELDAPKPQPQHQSMKYFHVKKRGMTNRARMKNETSLETSRFGKKKNSGWSVTVAGTLELSRSAPDLEMRLSFPMKGGPPVVSQSDSGFAEDYNCSKLSESLQDLDFGNKKQKWMVKVNNPESERADDLKSLTKSFSRHSLPDLESSRNKNAKKVLKDPESEDKIKGLLKKKMLVIWPKVQKVIRKEFLTESGRLITDLEGDLTEDVCLSVRGNAISLEKKNKPPTMTERDVTRRYTSRDNF